MKILHSRKGFTLIELLVVIGILAVLAAIAIPSVAGLIDRANKSADETNANEMTNAIERFTSEYELYCQDIASSSIDLKDMNSSQSRVFNVLTIMDRNGIKDVEYKNGSTIPENQIAICGDTKYPANAYTAQKIIQNYTKTSSSTFEPKQSDMHYWYSPECGVVVVAEPESTTTEKNDLVISGMDTKGNPLSETTKWIDITYNSYSDTITTPTDLIPEGAVYYVKLQTTTVGNYDNYEEKLVAGQQFPSTVHLGDTYVYGDYEYRYNMVYHKNTYYANSNLYGWSAKVLLTTKSYYGQMLSSINNRDVKSASFTYSECNLLKVAPKLPATIADMGGTYYNCTNLLMTTEIPSGVCNMDATFAYCSSLTTAPNLPSSVKTLRSTFIDCTSLKTAPIIPNDATVITALFKGCKNLDTYYGNNNGIGDFSNYSLPNSITNLNSTFYGCKSIMIAPKIPDSVQIMTSTFYACTSLTKIHNLPNSLKEMGTAFYCCGNLIDVSGAYIPSGVTNMYYAFYDCPLGDVSHFVIPETATNLEATFSASGLSGKITFLAIPVTYKDCFYNTKNNLAIICKQNNEEIVKELVNASINPQIVYVVQ